MKQNITDSGEEVKLRIRQLELKTEIRNGIDKICKKEKYQVTYAEINSALVEVLRSNLDYEMEDLYKEARFKDLKNKKKE